MSGALRSAPNARSVRWGHATGETGRDDGPRWETQTVLAGKPPARRGTGDDEYSGVAVVALSRAVVDQIGCSVPNMST